MRRSRDECENSIVKRMGAKKASVKKKVTLLINGNVGVLFQNGLEGVTLTPFLVVNDQIRTLMNRRAIWPDGYPCDLLAKLKALGAPMPIPAPTTVTYVEGATCSGSWQYFENDPLVLRPDEWSPREVEVPQVIEEGQAVFRRYPRGIDLTLSRKPSGLMVGE